MKNIIFLLSVVLFVSCKKEAQKEKTETTPVIEKETASKKGETVDQKENRSSSPSLKNTAALIGYYTGFFEASKYDRTKKPSYSNKITVFIDSITEKEIYGHSIVAGNDRPFRGNLSIENEIYTALVSEPGDDQYDGVFEFKFNPKLKRIKGIWVANDSKLAVSERKYELSRRIFIYNANQELVNTSEIEEEGYMGEVFSELYTVKNNAEEDFEESEYATIEGLKVNASNIELTNKDLENLYKGDLEIIRNAIYARHGYSFKNRRMRYFFDSQIDWYIPISTDVRNQLTDLEKKNIELIKRYEQHAERYYDYFGR